MDSLHDLAAQLSKLWSISNVQTTSELLDIEIQLSGAVVILST